MNSSSTYFYFLKCIPPRKPSTKVEYTSPIKPMSSSTPILSPSSLHQLTQSEDSSTIHKGYGTPSVHIISPYDTRQIEVPVHLDFPQISSSAACRMMLLIFSTAIG